MTKVHNKITKIKMKTKNKGKFIEVLKWLKMKYK